MNHKEILGALIVGFCLIFVASLLGSISSFNVSHASLERARGNIDVDQLRDAYGLSNVLTFVGQILQTVGGLVLAVYSAVGAFRVENKNATLGLLLFSALVAVFVLTTILFNILGFPIYYP